MLGGFFFSNVLSAALIADTLPKRELPKALGFVSVGLGVCYIVGPLLGALFSAGGGGGGLLTTTTATGATSAASRVTSPAPFWVSTGLSTTALTIAYIFLPSKQQLHEERQTADKRATLHKYVQLVDAGGDEVRPGMGNSAGGGGDQRSEETGGKIGSGGKGGGGTTSFVTRAGESGRQRLLAIVLGGHFLARLTTAAAMTVLPLRLRDRIGLGSRGFGMMLTVRTRPRLT